MLLFHDSLRHSADLDLLGKAEELPTAADLCASLATGLASAAEALDLDPLRVEASGDHVLVTEARQRPFVQGRRHSDWVRTRKRD